MTAYIILGAIIIIMGFIIYLTISRNQSLETDIIAQSAAIKNYKDQIADYGILEEEKKDVDLQNKALKEKLNNIDIDKYADRVSDTPKRTSNNKSSDS